MTLHLGRQTLRIDEGLVRGVCSTVGRWSKKAEYEGARIFRVTSHSGISVCGGDSKNTSPFVGQTRTMPTRARARVRVHVASFLKHTRVRLAACPSPAAQPCRGASLAHAMHAGCSLLMQRRRCFAWLVVDAVKKGKKGKKR